jgi:hypothetical protein
MLVSLGYFACSLYGWYYRMVICSTIVHMSVFNHRSTNCSYCLAQSIYGDIYLNILQYVSRFCWVIITHSKSNNMATLFISEYVYIFRTIFDSLISLWIISKLCMFRRIKNIYGFIYVWVDVRGYFAWWCGDALSLNTMTQIIISLTTDIY